MRRIKFTNLFGVIGISSLLILGGFSGPLLMRSASADGRDEPESGLDPLEEAGKGLDLIVIQPAEEQADPKRTFLDLVNKKLQLLASDELAQETQQLRIELAELEARRKLMLAEKLLGELVEGFPQTNAARRAQSMLDVSRRLKPEPDPLFRPASDEFSEPQSEVVPPRGKTRPLARPRTSW